MDEIAWKRKWDKEMLYYGVVEEKEREVQGKERQIKIENSSYNR